ncbi:MAG: electron transfer flavoprotein subunit alpha/FixB family protein [Gammaproteobacteria bacterium]|nr:electron transfer flavoprotein subunit alpha/FixB family protein [Gammaproteobacteria bacterium]
MTRILIVAEHDGSKLNPSTAKCVSCARGLDAEGIDIAVFANGGDDIAAQAARIDGVDRVLQIDRRENAAPLAAVLAPQIAALAEKYSHVLGPSTTFGKDVLPRAAALLGVGQVSDIMAIEGPRTFKRPIYAGNAIVTVEAPGDGVLVATVRIASFEAAGEAGAADIEKKTLDVELPAHTRYVELRSDRSDRPDLQTATRVISGGRALGSGENFDILYRLADKLGAAVGASRAAVDAGYVPNDMQVGQTGKIIAPELYIAVGISGAIQHLTGIKDAGTIVAINKDADAPIFEVADIGLVGNLFDIVPELEKLIGDRV